MQVRLLLGAAGSGKTFRCLSEARQALEQAPEGLPLLLVAPRQGTYQLEQQLLASATLAGFTRLSILSFESLARFVFAQLAQPVPRQLSDEGRVMVLRGLLAEKRGTLNVFRASARLTGFAQQLSQVLSEFQRAQLSPAVLRHLAGTFPAAEGLSRKLEDLAILFEAYLDWLRDHNLQDGDALLRSAVELLKAEPTPVLRLDRLWVDGFAEFSDLELDLLCALVHHCNGATLTFCLDPAPAKKLSWLSHWSAVTPNHDTCRKRLGGLTGVEIVTEKLERQVPESRFSESPVLRHLEENWAEPQPYRGGVNSPRASGAREVRDALRVVACVDREAEVTLAAREILAFVRGGARYRDVSVLVRKLDPYHQLIQRVFRRYQIPFFLDRRESVSHHPLAELTRSAVRVVAFGWRQEDWFAALKSGLFPTLDEEIDLIENEALARGWKGSAWLQPVRLKDVPKSDQDRERLVQLEAQLEAIRRKALAPIERFILALSTYRNRPTGPQLASAVRGFWSALQVEQQLAVLTADDASDIERRADVSVHQTVWTQMNAWLDNAALAFPRESLTLREWVPILEAGLANLTVGIIPPALDQVLVGAVDRSRTPEIKLALVLGLNESVFPALPDPGCLLTENDRVELENRDIVLGINARRHLGRERYLAYIACTRARQKLVLTWAGHDSAGGPLNPSSLVLLLTWLFPGLQPEVAQNAVSWKGAEHPLELAGTLLRMRDALSAESGAQPSSSAEIARGKSPVLPPRSDLVSVPRLAELFESFQHFANPQSPEALTPQIAERLYGPVLRTSVSRMEQFAECPFKFFVHSGLRAEERRLFELDIKEQGTFQHDMLALFHQELRAQGKRWRDLAPAEARDLVARLARNFATSFRDGLLEATEETRFTARVLTESLQDFVETQVGWMRNQYLFDPVEVELPFGETGASPAGTLDLGNGKQLELRGRIDRIDIYRVPGSDRALCVVVDYKSSHKQLDPVLVKHGLQLQLLTYLNVVRWWPNPDAAFGAGHLEPAGVFYVNLRGKYARESNRVAALADPDSARKLAYRHSGRFDSGALPQLDARPNAQTGDQFNYRLTKSGHVSRNCKEAVPATQLSALLNQVQNNLQTMGQQVFAGRAEVGPYRKGTLTACAQCSYRAICRLDPWTHHFRVLRNGPTGDLSAAAADEPQEQEL